MRHTPDITLLPQRAGRQTHLKERGDSIRRTFRTYLSRRGLSFTRQREAVLTCFISAGVHLETEQVYARLKINKPSVGRATVFRTVRLLQECGLLTEISLTDGRSRYELKADRPHHDHLICVGCGRIIEFQSPAMERSQNSAIRQHGFSALWHRHEIFGQCKGCQRRELHS